VVRSGVVAAPGAQRLEVPLVVGEAAVASDGERLLRQVCDWSSGSYFGEYDDILEDYVVGAGEEAPVAVAGACGDRATASCRH
jgi:hypothetical protein